MAIFGNNVINTYANITIKNKIAYGLFQMGTVSGTANSIVSYIRGWGINGKIKAAIYDADRKLLANGVTNEITGDTIDGWTTFTFSSAPTLTANAYYYLAIWADINWLEGIWTCYNVAGGNGVFYDDETYGSFPATLSLSTTDADGNLCIYCDYTPGVINELCDWITNHGGATGIDITEVFMIVDAYIYSSPPTGYGFIPTVENVMGIIDYYLGFVASGNTKTGCSF